MDSPQNYLAVIKVVGIGGGGVNAGNTAAQTLLMSDAEVKLDIGRETTKGLGAGSDAEVGRRAADEHADEIEEILKGSDMVFITAGEGGGTGTGGAPVVAEIARNLGALTIGVVTRPFGFRSDLEGLGHGVHHGRRGGRHRHRWRAGRGGDRTESRRPDDRRRDAAVRVPI